MRIYHMLWDRNNNSWMNKWLRKHSTEFTRFVQKKSKIILLWMVTLMLWISIGQHLLLYHGYSDDVNGHSLSWTSQDYSSDKSLKETVLSPCVTLQQYEAQGHSNANVIIIGENSELMETSSTTYDGSKQLRGIAYISEDTTYLIQSQTDNCTFHRSGYFMHQYSQFSFNHFKYLLGRMSSMNEAKSLSKERFELHYTLSLEDQVNLLSQKSGTSGNKLHNFISMLEAAVIYKSQVSHQSSIIVYIHINDINQKLQEPLYSINCKSDENIELKSMNSKESKKRFVDMQASKITQSNDECQIRFIGRFTYDRVFLSALQMYVYTYSQIHNVNFVYVPHQINQ